MDADRCIVCGDVIAEGIMVCPGCEYKVEQAIVICMDANIMSCEVCPLNKTCSETDADLLCCIIAKVQRKKNSLCQAVDWLKERFMKKR
ncbi:MAG: hypothetical protein ACYCWE_20990 [Eubacteriales bacterium]